MASAYYSPYVSSIITRNFQQQHSIISFDNLIIDHRSILGCKFFSSILLLLIKAMLLFCDVLYLYVNIRMTIYLVHE